MPGITFQRVITPLIHVLAWGLLALTLLMFQPSAGHVVLPNQYWVKQGVLLLCWIAVFYLTARVSVPRLLLRGHSGWFVLALVGTALIIMLAGRALEQVLHLPELMRQAFHAAEAAAGRPVPPRPPGTPPRGYRFDLVSLLITLVVLGIATAITMVQRNGRHCFGRLG
jgi:two-component system, LytTR family, sensor kinase